MSSYRDLIAWQRAMSLAEDVYFVTRSFPADERFGLTAQLRRCAVSVASDIAEGQGRLTTKDWQHFLAQARGSVQEMETQLLLAARLHAADEKTILQVVDKAEEVRKIINGLLRATSTRQPRRDFT